MEPDFKKGNGLLPVVIQDEITNKVLMLGYMNHEAFEQTKNSKIVTFYSRSKQRLWVKGETSGNFLHLKSIFLDCDQDTLLIKVKPVGPTCHTGDDTCFKEDNKSGGAYLDYLKKIIYERRTNPSEGSYTSSLFIKGLNKIAQKVGEEAVELVIEAMDKNDHLFKEEAADLLFHFLILLEQKNIDLEQVIEVLEKRHKA